MALIVTAAGIALAALPADAARVTGTFKGYENSTPQKGVYLHFENTITRDIYMALTADDGSFGTELPPGVYRLRSERGAILTCPIPVGSANASLGQVSDLAPYAPARLFDLQFLAPIIVTSPAPAAVNIGTVDTTAPLPPVTTKVKSPTLDLPTMAPPRTAVE